MEPKPTGKDDLKATLKQGASVSHGGGGRIPYPKHVWSPAGGWYAQPANWRANTAIIMTVMLGITLVVGNISGQLEYRARMPEPNSFYPSRWISRQIIEHERKQKELKAVKES